MSDTGDNHLSITPPRICLVFNSYAKLSSEVEYKNYAAPKGDVEDLKADGKIMYLTHASETLDFRFTAENTTGSPIPIKEGALGKEDFYYYIPVPKKNDNWDQHIQDKAFELDLTLAPGADGEPPVKVTENGGEGLVEVRYSTSVDSSQKGTADLLHYNNADAVESNYMTWEEFNRYNLKLENIRMIRISAKVGSETKEFPTGYTATFDFSYNFVQDPDELVGYAVEFGPCGIISYEQGGTDTTGHTPTQRVRAELQTGRIAGRVFIDEDFDGTFSDGDSLLRYEQTKDGDTWQDDATFYIEKAGASDGYNDREQGYDEQDAGFTLDIQAVYQPEDGDPGADTAEPHKAHKADFETNGTPNAYDNSYAISSLMARTYTVTMQNPGYTEGTVDKDSLRFVALGEDASSRTIGEDKKTSPKSPYTLTSPTGYQEAITFDTTIEATSESVNNNRMMDIALQRPHAVTFEVEYEDTYSAKPANMTQTIYAWHDTTITASGAKVPEFELADDFQWEGGGDAPTWTAEDVAMTVDSAITDDVTFTAKAVRVQHKVIYNANNGSLEKVPSDQPAVNGQKVTLSTEKPTHDKVGGKSVVFIGWTTKVTPPIEEMGDEKREKSALGVITSVTMEATDITVYALWGYDENNSDTADVLEDRYTLTYNENAISGSVTGGLPGKEENHLTDDKITLTGNPTHTAVDGKDVLFLGWTTTAPTEIYDKDDYEHRETIKATLVENVTIAGGDVTVYAVWGYDENGNNTLDYEEGALYGVTYDANGGDKPHDLIVEEEQRYLPGLTVTLWQPEDGSPWTKGSKDLGTQAVFVGWSTSNKYGETPVKTEPTDIVTTVTTPDATSGQTNVTVYAVWAEDKNANGTPDYAETQITIKFDPNGGTGATLSDITGCVAGASYALADGTKLTRVDSEHPGHNAVFVGWSLTKYDIIPQDAGDEGGPPTPELVRDPYTIPSDATDPITLYAVYGVDDNDDGIADYTEDAQHVAYYPNGGQKSDGTFWPNNEAFDTCHHHHVAGEDAPLMDIRAMTDLIHRDGAVLVGWSATSQPLLTTAPADDLLITTVEIPAEGNAKAYAVWAKDENGNHTADYLEEVRYGVRYDANGGSRPRSLTDAENTRYLPGLEVTLWQPTGADSPWTKNNAHAVFVGWSARDYGETPVKIKPADLILTARTPTSSTSPNVTVYAVWAEDRNGNGTPDYDETQIAIHYDLNGGSGPYTPADQSGLVRGASYRLSSVMGLTRADPEHPGHDAVFVGWSLTKYDIIPQDAKEKGEEPTLVGNPYTIPDNATGIITLYAVYGVDDNDDDIADYLEDAQHVAYYPNGGQEPDGTPYPNDKAFRTCHHHHVAHEDAPLMTVREMADVIRRDGAVLVGWSLQPQALLTAAPAEGLLVKTVKIPETGNGKVYAVWAEDANGNHIPDYNEDVLFGVMYEDNGGGRPEGLTVAQNTHYLPETEVTLWQPEAGSPWLKGSKEAGTQAVFVGWRADNGYGATPIRHRPTGIITTAETPAASSGTSNVTVYAVWAEDENANGTPDYAETQITIVYDLNGGVGTRPRRMTGLVIGASYALSDGAGLYRVDLEHPGHNAAFVGWSRTAYGIVPADAGDTGGSALPELVSNPYTIPTDAPQTFTLYAVYGVDDNDDGIADYFEDAQHVAYYPNGGRKPDGTPLADDAPFRICNHHHVAGENAPLMTADSMNEFVCRDGAVLLGWSVQPQALLTAAPAEGLLVDTVKIPDEGNGKVYAVWAIDANGNHVPDYNDPHYGHTYYRNAALIDWRGSSDNNFTYKNEAEGLPAGVAEITYGGELPDASEGILLNTCIDLAQPTLGSRTDKAADGTVLHHYVQLGWSGYCHPAAVSRAQANRWLLESNDEDLTRDGVQRKIAGPAFQFAFAVWALDDNYNGVADFEDGHYVLHYDANGGAGSVPADITLLSGETVTLDSATAPTRDRALFLGWSAQAHDPATSRSDAESWQIGQITAPKEISQPEGNVITVYALWAINENAGDGTVNAGKPDYEESHRLTYNGNPLDGGEVNGTPGALDWNYGAEADVDAARPVHSNTRNGTPVFLGWSTQRMERLLTRDDLLPTLYNVGDSVRIGAFDITLYAVWALDSDGDGTPDCEEPPGGNSGAEQWLETGDHMAYLQGYPDGRFGPDDNMTRAQVAQMFYNLLLNKNVPHTVAFSDVPADAWYAEAVNTLAAMGIVQGVGGGQYAPDRPVTRAEFVTIIMRFTDRVPEAGNIFSDVSPEDWYYDYVVRAVAFQWLNGYPDGTFGPDKYITRGEAAKITNGVLMRRPDQASINAARTLRTFADLSDKHWAYYEIMEAANAHDYRKNSSDELWLRVE